MGEEWPMGTRVEVNSEDQKRRERGADGARLRHPETASAQGVLVAFHKRGEWLWVGGSHAMLL